MDTITNISTNITDIDVNNFDNIVDSQPLKVISLFSGCGGKDLGIIGGFNYLGSYYGKNNFEIVYANDINKEACKTYKHNFNHDIVCSDIADLDLSTLPEADIVVGGFPCQDFSLAGKRLGLSSERGNLYLHMRNVIQHVRPKVFVAENVEGITNIDSTNVIDKIIHDFHTIGYNVTYKLFDTSEYLVPQKRKRVIIIGVRKDLSNSVPYPKAVSGKDGLPVRTAFDAIDDLWDKIDSENVFNHTTKDYSKAKFYPGKRMQGNRRIEKDEPSITIRAEHHGNIEGHYRTNGDESDMQNWRRLSVRECARIQSFPDDFKFMSAASSAYKQVGNAVPPVFSWFVFRALQIFMNELK